MTVRMGLIGCGRIADKHIHTMASMEAIQLVALCDISPDRMQAAEDAYRNLRSETETLAKYTDYQGLFRDSSVDAVVITALSGLHATIVLDAIKAGKPAMVEKPIALSLPDADRIIEYSKQQRIPVLVCHQLRYRPIFSLLHRCLQDGAMGRILYGSVSLRIRRDEAYYASASWRGKWELDGGMLINQGIHLLDLLLWMLGDAERIDGHIMRLQDSHKETEDAAIATVRFAAGSVGVIDANTVSHPTNLEQSLHVFAENGTVAISGTALNRIHRWHIPGHPQEIADQLLANRHEHQYMYEDFVRSVEHGKEPLMNAVQGRRSLELIYAIYRSHMTKRPIQLPVDDFNLEELNKSEGWRDG